MPLSRSAQSSGLYANADVEAVIQAAHPNAPVLNFNMGTLTLQPWGLEELKVTSAAPIIISSNSTYNGNANELTQSFRHCLQTILSHLSSNQQQNTLIFTLNLFNHHIPILCQIDHQSRSLTIVAFDSLPDSGYRPYIDSIIEGIRKGVVEWTGGLTIQSEVIGVTQNDMNPQQGSVNCGRYSGKIGSLASNYDGSLSRDKDFIKTQITNDMSNSANQESLRTQQIVSVNGYDQKRRRELGIHLPEARSQNQPEELFGQEKAFWELIQDNAYKLGTENENLNFFKELQPYLNQGRFVNLKSPRGDTLLHRLVLNFVPEKKDAIQGIITSLNRYGPDVTIKNAAGQSPLGLLLIKIADATFSEGVGVNSVDYKKEIKSYWDLLHLLVKGPSQIQQALANFDECWLAEYKHYKSNINKKNWFKEEVNKKSNEWFPVVTKNEAREDNNNLQANNNNRNNSNVQGAKTNNKNIPISPPPVSSGSNNNNSSENINNKNNNNSGRSAVKVLNVSAVENTNTNYNRDVQGNSKSSSNIKQNKANDLTVEIIETIVALLSKNLNKNLKQGYENILTKLSNKVRFSPDDIKFLKNGRHKDLLPLMLKLYTDKSLGETYKNKLAEFIVSVVKLGVNLHDAEKKLNDMGQDKNVETLKTMPEYKNFLEENLLNSMSALLVKNGLDEYYRAIGLKNPEGGTQFLFRPSTSNPPSENETPKFKNLMTSLQLTGDEKSTYGVSDVQQADEKIQELLESPSSPPGQQRKRDIILGLFSGNNSKTQQKDDKNISQVVAKPVSKNSNVNQNKNNNNSNNQGNNNNNNPANIGNANINVGDNNNQYFSQNRAAQDDRNNQIGNNNNILGNINNNMNVRRKQDNKLFDNAYSPQIKYYHAFKPNKIESIKAPGVIQATEDLQKALEARLLDSGKNFATFFEEIKQLMKSGASPSATDKNNFDAVHIALSIKDSKERFLIMEHLLSSMGDENKVKFLNTVNYQGSIPLIRFLEDSEACKIDTGEPLANDDKKLIELLSKDVNLHWIQEKSIYLSENSVLGFIINKMYEFVISKYKEPNDPKFNASLSNYLDILTLVGKSRENLEAGLADFEKKCQPSDTSQKNNQGWVSDQVKQLISEHFPVQGKSY